MQKQYCYDTVSNLGFRIGYGFSKNEGVIMQIRLNAKTIKLKSNVTYFGFSGGDGSITNISCEPETEIGWRNAILKREVNEDNRNLITNETNLYYRRPWSSWNTCA